MMKLSVAQRFLVALMDYFDPERWEGCKVSVCWAVWAAVYCGISYFVSGWADWAPPLVGGIVYFAYQRYQRWWVV